MFLRLGGLRKERIGVWGMAFLHLSEVCSIGSNLSRMSLMLGSAGLNVMTNGMRLLLFWGTFLRLSACVRGVLVALWIADFICLMG